MKRAPAAATQTRAARPPTVWRDVCALEDILPDTGVCALVDGVQIAIVRFGHGSELHAVSNFDPFSRAFVISRGLVGDRDGAPKIASPLYKQTFDLRTGQCLDDPAVQLPVYPVRLRDGRIEVVAHPHPSESSEPGR